QDGRGRPVLRRHLEAVLRCRTGVTEVRGGIARRPSGVVCANRLQRGPRPGDHPRARRAIRAVAQVSIKTPSTDTTEVSFPVTGMTCASCVRRIEKALGKVQGVQEASVNLATEKARVTYDSAIASPVQMRAAVEKAGYGVLDFPAAEKE